MATFITDLRHYLTADGRIAPAKGPAKRFAEFLTLVVAYATAPPATQSGSPKVSCVGDPGRKRCGAVVEAAVADDTHAIHWYCPLCGNRGMISRWETTLWDRTDDSTAH